MDLPTLFDYLVSATGQDRRDRQADRIRRLHVHHQLEPGRLLDRQVCRLGTSENLVDEGSRARSGNRPT